MIRESYVRDSIELGDAKWHLKRSEDLTPKYTPKVLLLRRKKATTGTLELEPDKKA